MADWTWVPRFPLEIEYIGPETLVSVMEDGSQVIREKSTTLKRIFNHEYEDTWTVYAAQMTFLRTKDLTTSFTLIVYDPEDATPLSTTATVRLIEFEEATTIGPLRARWNRRFREA